ncbi:MAG: TolC family protein [Candidatus Eremiobacteraeota bacterium]|nr:TolC family protein [Candidatus Eremiobacteraeota bacterium]MCW5866668.1 TolC family protein [Candidatus Eremiobacteraeota bacterium]
MRVSLAIAFSLLLQAPLSAQPASVRPPSAAPLKFTLEEALRKSLDGNPDIGQAEARIVQAQKAIDLAYVPLQPTLTSTLSYTRILEPIPQNGLANFFSSLIPGLVSSSSTTPSANNYNGTLVLQKTITTFGRVHWTALAKKLAKKQSQQDYRTAIEQLLQTVEKAYISVQLAEVQVKLARSRLDNHNEYLRLSQNLFKAGEIAEFEIIQSNAALQSTTQSLLDAEKTADTAQIVLAVLLDLPPLTPLELADVPPPPEPPDYQPGLERALVRRPELAGLRWSLASAQANAIALGLTNSPTLSAFSQYSGNYVPVTPPTVNWVAGLQLSVPILDGGQAVYLQQQAKAVSDEIRQSIISQERSVKQDVAQNYVLLKSYWAQMKQAKIAAEQNDQALKIAFNRFRAGVSNGTELLNAQDNWANSQLTLLSVEASYRTSLADWRRSISAEYPFALPESMTVDWELPPMPSPPGEEPSEEQLNPNRPIITSPKNE